MASEGHRSLIIEKSLDKFRKYGIRRVTMDEIARDLRLSKKTLYQHFPDKESLVKACIERNVEQILPEVAAVLTETGSAVDRIHRVWKILEKIPRLITVELMADLRSDYPQLWEEIDARRHAVVGRVEAVLERGIASGDIRPGIHPKVVMRMMFAVMERVLNPDVLTAGEFSPQEALTTIVTVATRGMFRVPPELPAKEDAR